MKKICFVTTSPLIVNFFLVPLLASLGQRYRVFLAVNTAERTPLLPGHGAEVIALPIERKLSPWADLRTLAAMVRLFREHRFDAVHSFSPKAGLLATLAGQAAGVGVRIHTYTGQVWVTRSGFMRWVLASADRSIAKRATHLLADSPSQRRLLLESGIVRDAGKCRVLGSGSVSGVDPARFRSDAAARATVRASLGIAPAATVFLFLGRLTRDKGVLDLAGAFAAVAAARRDVVLLLVGPDEDRLRPVIESLCGACTAQLRFAGYTDSPERYLAAADVLCLPSYREGFGSVIIEAAAMGIPAIGSRIYGITDAIVEGRTGLLHTPADARDLADKMLLLIADPARRAQLGTEARRRALEEFDQQRLTRAMLDYYREALGE